MMADTVHPEGVYLLMSKEPFFVRVYVCHEWHDMSHVPEGGTVKCYHVNPDENDYLFDMVIETLSCFSSIELLHLEYGIPACSPNLAADINHLEKIQRLATRLVTGKRRGTAATGPSFLAAASTSGWPDYRLQDIQGPFGYCFKLVFNFLPLDAA